MEGLKKCFPLILKKCFDAIAKKPANTYRMSISVRRKNAIQNPAGIQEYGNLHTLLDKRVNNISNILQDKNTIKNLV